MSDEIQTEASLVVSRDRINLKQNLSARFDQAAPGAWAGTQAIGTSEEDLVLSGVTTPGAIHIVNDDEDNYVQWGPKAAGVMVPLGRIGPGQQAMFYLDTGVTVRMKANTAECNVSVFVANQ